jgi:ribosomal protein S27AE
MELNGDAIASASVAYDTALEGRPATTGNRLYAMRKAIEGYVDAARRPVRCQARQHSDQMLCGRCGLGWDVNDPDPPACSPTERRLAPRRADELFDADGLPGDWNAPA